MVGNFSIHNNYFNLYYITIILLVSKNIIMLYFQNKFINNSIYFILIPKIEKNSFLGSEKNLKIKDYIYKLS